MSHSEFAIDYQDAQNPGSCAAATRGEFVLRTEDFERLIKSYVGVLMKRRVMQRILVVSPRMTNSREMIVEFKYEHRGRR